MLNFHELRQRFKNKGNDPSMFIALLITFIICLVIMIKDCHAAEIPTDKAILAVIGEAENQNYFGMLAVASAIRNRGTLKGVAGLNSKRVREHLYSQDIYELATKAWFASYYQDITDGATGWGNADDIEKFKKEKWWKNCVITAHIVDHWFYREAKQ